MSQDKLKEELVKFLQDAHAMEQQSLQTLQAAVAVAGDPQLESLYQGHVMETQHHLELLKERLETHDASRSLMMSSEPWSATALLMMNPARTRAFASACPSAKEPTA